jgi:hypothetical protein
MPSFRLLALLLALPTLASAQVRPGIRPIQPSRSFIGIGGIMAVPQGEFSSYVGNGGGLGFDVLAGLDRAGALQLRIEGGFLRYGNEARTSCLGTCRITVRINTSNNIFVLGVGPQIMLVPPGPVRPYVTGTAGLAYFFTQSSMRGTSDATSFAETKNFEAVTFALTGGGGLQVRLRDGARPILLDIGARYHHNGETSYLRKGSIIDHPDGSITIQPIRSEANFLALQLGVRFGI